MPLGAVADVRSRLQLLQFQLAKFRREPDDDARVAEPLRAATEAHLRALYAVLIAPIRDRLQASHLVVSPARRPAHACRFTRSSTASDS